MILWQSYITAVSAQLHPATTTPWEWSTFKNRRPVTTNSALECGQDNQARVGWTPSEVTISWFVRYRFEKNVYGQAALSGLALQQDTAAHGVDWASPHPWGVQCHWVSRSLCMLINPGRREVTRHLPNNPSFPLKWWITTRYLNCKKMPHRMILRNPTTNWH